MYKALPAYNLLDNSVNAFCNFKHSVIRIDWITLTGLPTIITRNKTPRFSKIYAKKWKTTHFVS